jgi:hypothetical protein
MSEPSDATPVEELTAACSRSAQALRLAILAVEDEAMLAKLRAAYVERVGLFEVCARCLAAGAANADRIQELASGAAPDAPLTATEALERVRLAERGFERTVVALGRPLDANRGRLAELARGQLATARSLGRGGAQRRGHAQSTGTPAPAVL